ncbi:hypothetical protein [Actinomadura sp. 3N407]|uniref:hypothetical protein n=1 Tax=Actinomadura sp. 3N407 TaxID=3457423 RepID=UPI003FCEB5AE
MTGAPQWSGEMLDRPEMVEAFSTQLRRVLASHVDYVARIRRDAEAMWDANPPEGYSTFEAWWRARWVKGPLAEIQEHLEAAAALTFKLEARYRKGRHEIPTARQTARQAKGKAPELDPGPGPGSGRFGDRTRSAATGAAAPAPAQPQTQAQSQAQSQAQGGGGFMDMVREGRSA